MMQSLHSSLRRLTLCANTAAPLAIHALASGNHDLSWTARRALSTAAAATSIPIRGVARKLQAKVADEAAAIKAQEVMQKIHNVLKKEAKGYVGSTRFVCKSEWDVFVWYRFTDMDSLKNYLGSETKSKKVEPLIGELDKIALAPSHSQNFAADDW